MDKRQRQVEMIRSKYLRQIVELMDKHKIDLLDLQAFLATYKPISVQMKERREVKLAVQRNKASLEKARLALKAKREAKQNG